MTWRLSCPWQQENSQNGPAAIINVSQINKDQAGAYISGTPVEENNSICHLWMGPLLLTLPLCFREGDWNFYIPHKYFPAPSSSSPYLITWLLYLYIMLNITFTSSQPSFPPFSTLLDLEGGLAKIQTLRLPLPPSLTPSRQLSHTEPQVLQGSHTHCLL